jgi:Ca2+-binding RTX toxin-like protein
MIGINLSGAEFGKGNVYGRDYAYPTVTDLALYTSHGIDLVRLPVKWERLQPVAGGPLDPAELGHLKAFLGDATASGAAVIVDLHNYGRYNGAVLGSAGASNADFAAFWKTLATAIGNSPALAGYDLMNEPHNMGSATVWPSAAQAAIDAIRSVDSQTAIYVEGDNWASADTWTRSNKALVLRDPADNLVYEAHLYLDRYGAGTYAQSYDAQGAQPLLGVQRLQSFENWLVANNARGFIGEVAVPKADPRWLPVLDNLLAAADSYGIDVAYWGGGARWGNYPLAPVDRAGNPNTTFALLDHYVGDPAPVDGVGTAGNDVLAGGRGNDIIHAGAGGDMLRGGAGADLLDGGPGIDAVNYRASPAAVDVDLLRASQTGGDAQGDVLISIETLQGSGYGDVLRGDAGPNALHGYAGADILEGRGGGDLLDGGAGRDTVQYAMAVDIDLARTIQPNGDRLVSIENLTGSMFADRLAGDAGANVISGGGGDDWIAGNGGGDTLDGGVGNDTVSYADARAGLTISLEAGRAGSDRLAGFENALGGSFGDTLRGNVSDNRLDGGTGDDRIIGLGGADMLTGGAGADRFVFSATRDSLPSAPDTITDFLSGADKIDLSGIDAVLARSGNQHFSFIGTAAFTAPGQVRIDTSVAGQTLVLGNIDADLHADFALTVHSAAPLMPIDFIL